MREIKFRVWNKEDKLMCAPLKLEQIAYGVYVSDFKNGVVMQFTGLKDNKEKEIYEGDILRHVASGYEPRDLYEIVWSDGSLSFRLKFLKGDRKFSNRVMPFKDFEIIGNIYENSDLLK